MEVRIKRLVEDAVLPKYGRAGDAGMDLVAVSKSIDEDGNVVYGTGLAFEIPYGYMGLLFPRSSNARKDLLLSNSVGLVDAGYRGEVSFKYKPSLGFATIESDEDVCESINLERFCATYEVGDRVGQMVIMPFPKIEFIEVEELGSSERGDGGYGSTGK